jgi:HlyD family secretion protein
LSRNSSSDLAVRQFQSEADAIREAPEPLAARLTVFVLAGFLASMVAIMVFTKVDRVITSVGGKIVPTQGVQVFQSLDPSIIKSLDVREGDQVQAGQLLATLDPTFAAADVKQLNQQISSLEAQIARDQALIDSKPLVFPARQDADFQRYVDLQTAYYNQQIAQYKAQLNSFDAKAEQAQATIQKYRADESHYNERNGIAEQIEGMRTLLAEHGTGSQLNKLISQDARMEMQRQIENNHNSLIEAEHALVTTQADREAFTQQWSGQLSAELVKARNDLDTARSSFEKASKHQDLVRLVAPEPSMVLTEAKLSVGSVLKEGDTLFTLMPLNSPVEAEFRIVSRDIGFVRPGDHCVLKVDAFNFMEHGTASGTVRWISDGAFTTDDNGQAAEAYYKARCSVDEVNMMNVPGSFRFIPGMTLQADVNVGKRSVAMYLLGSVLRGYNEAMREP